jgi:hypothetical protein
MGAGSGVRFELERLALEGDELVVRGFWTGANGMRFVRPTLHFEDRRILATLEHKPWAPSDGQTWTAAFPWTDGRAVDADRLALAVGPRVIVPLGDAAPAPIDETVPAPDAKATAAAAKPKAIRPAQPKPPPAEPAPPPAAEAAPAPAGRPNDARTPPPVVLVDERSDELARALAAAERERDRARAEREEILIAYAALKRQLRVEHAEADRAARGRGEAESDGDEPISVRTVPAMRGVMAELQYPPREPKRRLAAFDLWVVRVVGLAAAACVILLLLSIVRAMG